MKNIVKRLAQLDNMTGNVYSIELFSDGSGTLLCYYPTDADVSEADKYVFSFADLDDLNEQLTQFVQEL